MRYCFLATSLLAGVIHAQEAQDVVFERLAKAEYFAFGGTGYAGVRSQAEKDYKLILSRPSAMMDFERLYSLGNPQAKSYALVGIHKLSPTRFKEILSSVRMSKEEIVTQNGCLVSHEHLGTIVQQIQSGQYSRE
jgi:hypothetical protein